MTTEEEARSVLIIGTKRDCLSRGAEGGISAGLEGAGAISAGLEGAEAIGTGLFGAGVIWAVTGGCWTGTGLLGAEEAGFAEVIGAPFLFAKKVRKLKKRKLKTKLNKKS